MTYWLGLETPKVYEESNRKYNLHQAHPFGFPAGRRLANSPSSEAPKFRRNGSLLNGAIQKPTGAANTTVVGSGKYYPADSWTAVRDSRLMGFAKYLALEIKP